MTDDTLALTFALTLGTAIAGLVLGLGYFALLRRTVELYEAGGHHLSPAALTAGRLIGAVIWFTFAAQLGAGPLLGAFLGFLLARSLALRTPRGTV